MNRNYIILFFIFVILTSIFLAFWELDQVDLEASEDIYIADSVGYLRQDPYIVPRHHLRKPHAPASPHPFFVQLLTYLVFRIFGLSIFSARLLQASSLIITTLLVMFISYQLYKLSILAIFSGFIYATIPLVVRFSRMAVLDPMLALIVALGMIWSWSLISVRGRHIYIFAGLCGLTLGISASIKLTGIFYFIPFVILLFLFFIKSRKILYIKVFLLFLFNGALVFVLFNDPYSYIYSWANFSDPKYKNISLTAILKGPLAFRYWYLFVISLIGFGIVSVCIIAAIRYRRFWISNERVFILTWLLSPIIYLILNPPHITGLSAEWSYVPVFVPLSLIIGKTLIALIKRQNVAVKISVICLYFATTFVPLLSYGLRFKPMPLASFLHARNVVRNDLAVTKTIYRLNQESRNILVLVQLKSVGFPLWLLNDTIRTEPMYRSIDVYDFVVTDNQDLITTVIGNGFTVVSREKNPTESEIVLLEKGLN